MVEELLKKLMKLEAGTIRSFFYYKTSSKETADDLYQDLMIRLIRSGKIKQANNPKSYLFRAASNLVKDYYRKKSNEQDTLSQIKDRTEFDHDPITAERILIAQQKFKIVEDALDELPDRCRQIFWMVRLEGKKQQDVAETLNISLRTVENNLRKALLHCQHRLEEKGMSEK
jgi:RNA polymerase sigma-70 factor (ECF subfamily)